MTDEARAYTSEEVPPDRDWGLNLKLQLDEARERLARKGKALDEALKQRDGLAERLKDCKAALQVQIEAKNKAIDRLNALHDLINELAEWAASPLLAAEKFQAEPPRSDEAGYEQAQEDVRAILERRGIRIILDTPDGTDMRGPNHKDVG